MTYPIYRVVQPPGVIRWPSLGTTATPSTATHARFLRWDVLTHQNPVIRWDSRGTVGGSNPTPGRAGLGGDDVPRPYRKSPELGWDKKAYKTKKAREDAIEATLKQVYADLTETAAPLSVLARVDEIVKPVARRVKRDAPLVIDWKEMAQREKQAEALMALWQEEQDLRRFIEEDDEAIIMLMMH